ncbi:hypothetical protein HR45_08940 [Shewanella mangrovi]|uniref:CopL family metal-binding regulatory protein n=1 Tax=Shewanella mangrovi TaxID=1515746 RepID=A0A094JCA6_9GAMM|nr:hypothetical protein [Shewanella mangrovi]KFZ37545.1 hypothetical protein HR45_08940 [Shewanella mangrovi]
MQSIRRYIWTLLLLLAFVGQGLVSNGMTIMPAAKAEPLDAMMLAHHQMNSDMKCSDTAMPDCCDGKMALTSVLPDAPAHHCGDSKGMCCKGHCHCTVASIAGSLVTAHIWSNNRLPETAVATPEPHFTSIAVNPAFKPPIA